MLAFEEYEHHANILKTRNSSLDGLLKLSYISGVILKVLAQTETIERAKNALITTQNRISSYPTFENKKLSQASRLTYEKELANLRKETTSWSELLENAKQTTSINTWYKRRAALQNYIINKLTLTLAEIEGIEFSKLNLIGQQTKLNILSDVTGMLEELEKVAPIEKEIRMPKKSKRQDLRGLPEDWREQILSRMPKYNEQILTLILTGCRPSELVKGIKLVINNNLLEAHIAGSKIGKYSGQKIRVLNISIEGESAKSLLKSVIKNGGEKIISVEKAINLTTAIRSAGRRAFPKLKKSITAYSFRHQFAADFKSIANSAGEDKSQLLLDLSAALGHASDKTKGYYGHIKQARSGRKVVVGVEASRPVNIKYVPDKIFIKKQSGYVPKNE